MTLVLQIVVGVVFGGLLLIVLGFLLVRFLLWRLKSNLTKSLGELGNLKDLFGGAQMISTELDLEPVEDDTLEPEASDRVAEFESLGFERAGAYEIEGQEVTFALLANESQSCWAAVTQSGIGGVSCDVVSHHSDGRWLTHMSLKDLGLDAPAGIEKVRVPGASPSELVERHLAERPAGDYEPATVDNAVDALRTAFRDENLLRAWNGGLSEKEMAGNLKATGTDADEGQSTMVVMMARMQATAAINDAFEKAFRNGTTLPVKDWEDIEDRLLFVHAMSDGERLAVALDPESEDAEAAADKLGQGEAKALNFASANEALPPDRRLRSLGPIEIRAANRTLRADVYVEPEEDDE